MFPILIMIKYGTPDFLILDEFWKKQKNGTCIVRHTLFVHTLFVHATIISFMYLESNMGSLSKNARVDFGIMSFWESQD